MAGPLYASSPVLGTHLCDNPGFESIRAVVSPVCIACMLIRGIAAALQPDGGCMYNIVLPYRRVAMHTLGGGGGGGGGSTSGACC